MAKKGISRLPIEAWQAGSLRLTAFPVPSEDLASPNWWAVLMGEPAETTVSQPKKGGHQEEGPFEGGKLRLTVRLSRIDWALMPVESEELGSFPIIGSFSNLLTPFVKLMHRWFELPNCPPVQRVAFGTILFAPVENREVGYDQLSAYLPSVKLDSEAMSDLLFQINRRRDSKAGVPGLKINRLSKWSVSRIDKFEVSLGKESLRYGKWPALSACRLEIDINTMPEFEGVFSKEQLPVVFDELVTLGCEIIAEGDIP